MVMIMAGARRVIVMMRVFVTVDMVLLGRRRCRHEGAWAGVGNWLTDALERWCAGSPGPWCSA